jgi:hypothetical protein
MIRRRQKNRGVVRNMVATPDGKLYLASSGVNKVGIAELPH